MQIETVYRDGDVWVVNKPSGIASTAKEDEDSLVRRLEADCGHRLHPSSRLDAEVTGLLTLALHKEAMHGLQQARKDDAYKRLYAALCGKSPSPTSGEWNAAIAIDERNPRLRRVCEDGKGQRVQHALTHYRVEPGGLDAASLLWLWPQTGRTHQLRVHSAHAGHPLLGDVRYGGDKRVVLDDGRVLRAKRVMLHCTRLSIRHPRGEMLTLESQPPEDFMKLHRSLQLAAWHLPK